MARYVQEAVPVVDDILARGKLPIVAGGTGLYIDNLVAGRQFAPFTPDSGLREALQARASTEGLPVLLEELRAVDSAAAERLHPNDEKRIIRALEVWYETGCTITEHDRQEQQRPPKYDALYIGLDFLDRQDLRDRIDKRVDTMVEQGLLEEVEALLASGLPRDATALQAIGYKQFLAVAEGTATRQEAIAEVKLRSRQYAKRQLTWLRRNPDIFWVRWERRPNFPEGLQKATEYLHSRGLC